MDRRPALLIAAVALAACGTPRARVVRRPATAAERNAVVECATAIVLDEGFEVIERRPDVGLLSAAWTSEERARSVARGPKGGGDIADAPAGADESSVLTVSIAHDPVNRALSLLVRASAQAGDSAVAPSPRAALARDRIIRSCAYLVG